MISFVKTWIELKTDKRAVTALEYGLIAAVIGAVMVVGASTLGTSLSSKFVTLAGTV
jgi:pilus assembly protein Flp/PilA